jgi:hypothetical protein
VGNRPQEATGLIVGPQQRLDFPTKFGVAGARSDDVGVSLGPAGPAAGGVKDGFRLRLIDGHGSILPGRRVGRPCSRRF